jgi:uncharacterized protein (TIGR02118 family)
MHRLTVQYFDPTDGDAFLADYRARHVPLVQAIPGLARFTLTTPRGDGAPYLQAELWFADSETMQAGLSSPEMGAAAEDAETYDVARRAMFSGEVEDI